MIQACLPTWRSRANPNCSKLHRRTEQEAVLGLAAGGRLRDRLNQTAACRGDVRQRGGERRPGDAQAAVALVDEDAGDPPAGGRRTGLAVFAMVFEAELVWAAVLAPALGVTLCVKHQGGVGAAGSHQSLFQRTGVAAATLALRVVGDAPASAVDAVVALKQVGEGVPCDRVERAA
jgi:hypothetical protein